MHDLVEDTHWTLEKLREEGFSERVIEGIKLLTKLPEISYDKYIFNMLYNLDVIKVKLSDLKDNSDITRLKGITEKDLDRIKKYNSTYHYLNCAKNRYYKL